MKMDGRCYKCNRVLTTGDFDGMCSDCRKQTQEIKPIKAIKIYVDYGTHKNEEMITIECLKKLLDSIENCEVKK